MKKIIGIPISKWLKYVPRKQIGVDNSSDFSNSKCIVVEAYCRKYEILMEILVENLLRI